MRKLKSWILAPYHSAGVVYLFPAGKRDACAFMGRVYSYLNPHIPLISIARDAGLNKEYKFGQLLFNISESEVLFMEKGKVVKKEKREWIGGLEIFDVKIGSGRLSEYTDYLFGKERVTSRRSRQMADTGRRRYYNKKNKNKFLLQNLQQESYTIVVNEKNRK